MRASPKISSPLIASEIFTRSSTTDEDTTAAPGIYASDDDEGAAIRANSKASSGDADVGDDDSTASDEELVIQLVDDEGSSESDPPPPPPRPPVPRRDAKVEEKADYIEWLIRNGAQNRDEEDRTRFRRIAGKEVEYVNQQHAKGKHEQLLAEVTKNMAEARGDDKEEFETPDASFVEEFVGVFNEASQNVMDQISYKHFPAPPVEDDDESGSYGTPEASTEYIKKTAAAQPKSPMDRARAAAAVNAQLAEVRRERAGQYYAKNPLGISVVKKWLNSATAAPPPPVKKSEEAKSDTRKPGTINTLATIKGAAASSTSTRRPAGSSTEILANATGDVLDKSGQALTQEDGDEIKAMLKEALEKLKTVKEPKERDKLARRIHAAGYALAAWAGLLGTAAVAVATVPALVPFATATAVTAGALALHSSNKSNADEAVNQSQAASKTRAKTNSVTDDDDDGGGYQPVEPKNQRKDDGVDPKVTGLRNRRVVWNQVVKKPNSKYKALPMAAYSSPEDIRDYQERNKK